MKTLLCNLRGILERNRFGDSIIAFVIAVALTLIAFSFYIGFVTGINLTFFSVEPAQFFDTPWPNGSVVFNFFALGILWRYVTFVRVLRYMANAIHEVSIPYRGLWRQRRFVTALSPIVALPLVIALGVGVVIKLDERRTAHHTTPTQGLIRP